MELKQIHPVYRADALANQAEEVKTIAEKVAETCEALLKKCHNLSADYPDFESLKEWPDTSQLEEIEALNARLRVELHSAYQALTTPQTYSYQRTFSEAACDDFNKYNDTTENIFCMVEENKLYVKLPLLWHRGRYTKWVKRHRVDFDYLHWFEQNLDTALTLIDDKMPTYFKKNISYLFVVAPDSRMANDASNLAADSDNYDTKVLSDVIVSHMFGGDTAVNCSFSYASIVSDELPEGTYITVSEGLDISLNIDGSTDTWKNHFVKYKIGI